MVMDITGEGVSTALPSDEGVFLTIWEEAIKSQYAIGGTMIPSLKTMAFFRDLFRAYVAREMEGVVLFGASENAVLLWGDVGNVFPWETTIGKFAMGWGTYVRPDYRRQGWARALRDEAMVKMYDMGFDTVIGTAVSGNEAGNESLLDYGATASGTEWTMKVCDFADFQKPGEAR
tara:strand:- start:2590 stop:3114 length:525 start_codon:yes stop_codon:yes gene_type:complete